MILSLLLLIFAVYGGLAKSKERFDILNTSKYLKLEEQFQFLHRLHNLASPVMKLEVLGNTFIEGKEFENDIYLVEFGDKTAPVIFFDCGIHAREWIASATCLFLIQKLASVFHNLKTKKKIRKDEEPISKFRWQFIPMLNPDGYNLSHTEDRMYRKNGRPYDKLRFSNSQIEKNCSCEEKPQECRGVDLNRNFPAGWGEGSESFARDSGFPCKEMYRGPHPLSEPETKILDKHITSLGDQIIGAFSFHSYGQEIYHPKGWLSDEDKDQIHGTPRKLLEEFAEFFNKPMKFGIGNVYTLLGTEDLEGGTTDDYYFTNKNINVTYTIELDPHLDDYEVGFELDASRIRPVGIKMWKALKRMAEKFQDMYPS